MLLDAGRRLLLLLVSVAAGTALVSLALGALAGSKVDRSVSLGWYIIGSFLLVAGFFIGNRGPFRAKGDDAGGLLILRARPIRRATLEEREEAINNSAVFVTVGLVLIILGVAADSRFSLF